MITPRSDQICIKFKNVTPSGKFPLDKASKSPIITIQIIDSESTLKMMFSEKMNFDRLKNIKLSELKIIEDSKVVPAIEITTFNDEKVQMDSKVTFESQ